MSTISKALPTPPDNFSTQIATSSVGTTTLSVTLDDASDLPTEGVGQFFKKDSQGVIIPGTIEFCHWTGRSSNTITFSDTLDRGITGSDSGAQSYVADDYFEVWVSSYYNGTNAFDEEHNADGTHKETALDSMITGTEAQGDIIYHNGTIWTRLPKGTDGQVLTQASSVPSWASASGKIAQVVTYVTGAVATGTTVIPNDDSIPQNTEGNEYMTLAITPTNVSSVLVIQVIVQLNGGSNQEMIAALFQDTTANALAAIADNLVSGEMRAMGLTHKMTAGTTSATTFKVRAGGSNAGTTTFNGNGGTRRFGGVCASSIIITEILP